MGRTWVWGLAILLGGCAGANISSQVRESGEPGSNKMLRCVDIETGRFNSGPTRAYRNVHETVPSGEIVAIENGNEVLKQYDGWKLVYVSEYTTENKRNSAAVMCFEKPLEK